MRADRLISILMLLQARGRMTASELAVELEVSERTIYRDLEALNASGVPVMTERGPGGGAELPQNYRSNLTGLSETEVRGLFLSAVPGPIADLGLGKAVEAAVLKLTAALPAAHRQELEQVRERIHVDTADWFSPEEPLPHLGAVQRAVWEGRRVMVSYLPTTGGRIRRCLEPYGLVAKGTVWYVVAAVADGARVFGVSRVQAARRQLVVYRVSRIMSVDALDETFHRPEDFNLQTYWETWCREFQDSMPRYIATVKVESWFVPTLVRLVGEGVRGQLENAPPSDERGRVSVKLTYDSFEGAVAGTLGLGTGAEVVAPSELREAVLNTASDLVDLYTREPRRKRAQPEERS